MVSQGDHGVASWYGWVCILVAANNNSTEEADLVIAAGIRFHDRITGHPDFFCKKLKSSISISIQQKLIKTLLLTYQL